MTRWLTVTLFALTAATGCKADQPEASSKPPPTVTPVTQPGGTPGSAPAAPPAPRLAPGELVGEKGGLKVSELLGSPKFPAARLAQTTPADGAKLAPGKVAFSYEVRGYALTEQTVADPPLANSAKGQHIHFILNNGPYLAKYTPSFEVDMPEGHNVVLAFLSRAYHEALKTPGAAAVKLVTVGNPSEAKPDLTAPHLFYSRPKGTYDAAGRRMLLLDFYLVNTTLSKGGNQVRATLNGHAFMLSRWVPYVVEGLQPGPLTVELELVDKDGKMIPGPFNKVKRTATLD